MDRARKNGESEGLSKFRTSGELQRLTLMQQRIAVIATPTPSRL